MLGATPSFTQMSTGGANPQGILEDISTRSLKTVRIGELAGKLATGTGNVFTGYGAAAAGASINNSVLVGFESGRFASSLSSATFVGAFTGARADRSHETTLVGYAAGELMKDCTQCVGVGAYTLREATALQTTAVGCRALERSLDADYNVGVGAECMQNNRSGSFNTAVGFQAMRAAFTSSECVMIGAYAGYSNALGTGITAVGYRSCEFMEDGAYSVAVGAYSLQNSSFTSNTVAIGPFAGKTAAAENAVLIGTNVASDATSIVGSVIVGESAGSHHEGSNTVIIGARTARNVQGDDSVIIGADALTGGGLDIIANSTIAIGSNVAPSLRSSENSVLIGPGADSFRSSLTLGIAIGTVETTTNDKSISIGGNIENARISSVLIGNQLSSDADNSVLLGKGITVSSVIFFKNPLVFPYVKAVARDAYNKIGASNINYTNILKSPDGIDTYLVASAGYLTTPIANSSSIFMDLLPNPITSYDLRTHAPNLNYALVNGVTFLITNTPANPSASNIWATTSDSSLSAFTLGLSSSSITTFADAYQEDHSFTITQLPTTTTVNITNFDKSSIVVPVFAPKRAIYAKATSEQAQVPIPITSINTPMTLSPSFSNPSASFAIEQIMPTNISKCNIVFEPVLQPTYGMLSNVASRFPTYTMPIESVFATTDAFQVRPVQVMKETYTETQHSLKHFDASNIYSVSVSDSRLFLPNALPASNIINLSTNVITYGPVPTSVPSGEQLCVRLTEIPQASQWVTAENTVYSSNDVLTMITSNIDAYPDAQNATYFATAKTAIDTAVQNIKPVLAQPQLSTQFDSLLANLKTLSNYMPVNVVPNYQTAYTSATQNTQNIINWGVGSSTYDSLWASLNTQSQYIISNIRQERAEVNTINSLLTSLTSPIQTSKLAIESFVSTSTPLFNTLNTNLQTLSTYIGSSQTANYNAALARISQESSKILSNGTETTNYNTRWASIQSDKDFILSIIILPDPPQLATIQSTLLQINTTVGTAKTNIQSFTTSATPILNNLIADANSLSNVILQPSKPAYNSAIDRITQYSTRLLNDGKETTNYTVLKDAIATDAQLIISYITMPDPPEVAIIHTSLSNIEASASTFRAAANTFTTSIAPLFSSLITDLRTLSNITPTSNESAYTTALTAVLQDTSSVSNGGIDTTQMDTLITNIHSNTQIILSNVVFPVLEPPEIARISSTLNSVNTSIASFKTQITTYMQAVNPLFINLTSKLTSLSTYIPTLNQASYTALMNTVQLRITAFQNWNLASFDSVAMFESLSSISQAIINLVYIPDPQAATDMTSALSQLSSYVSTALANAQAYVSTVTSLLNTLISNVNALSPIILANKVTEYNEAIAFINDDKVQLLNTNIGLTNYDSIYSSLVSQTNFILSIYRVPDPSQVGIISTTSTSIASHIATALTKMETYITTATPLFTQLRTNLVSLSDVIPADKTTLYNTAVAAVTQDTTSILNRNIGSTNYDPLYNTIKTNSQYVTSIIRIPDPVQVAAINTILSNASTAIFATYGIAPIGNNLVLLYNAVRNTPPLSASSSRTFFSQSPTNTHGKTAAAAYDLWWTKYTIPRAFIALPTPLQPSSYIQAVSPSTVIENTSIKIKIPDVLTSSVTTTSVSDSLTIRVNAAQPLIHPNWDLSSNWTHDISQSRQLFTLDVATMSILIPPQYGSLIKATTSPTLSLSNYEYTPSHPFYTDDTTLLVTNTLGSSQVINVGFTRPNIPPIYTQTIHAPWKASTETKTWGHYTSNIVSQNITTLSNLQIFNGSETNEISPDVGTIIYPTQSNYFPTTYNPTIGLSTYTSNVTKSRIITKQQNYNNFQNQNQLNVTFTYTYSNIVYGFNNNILSTNKIVSPSTQFTIYTPLEPPNVNEQKYTIDSNELLLVREYRKQSFDSYTDSVIGETLAFSVSNWFDGSAPTHLYSCNIFTESPNITTVSYQVETPIGSSVASQLERNLISTSNIIQTIATAAVRPHQLATSGPSSSIFSANADLYKMGIGKVNQFTALDVLNNTIFVPVSSEANDYIITANNATATLSVKGYSIGSSVKTIDSTKYEFILDPTIYKVSLSSLLSSSSTYVLQADDGYIDGQTFIPNSPMYGSERTLTYFTANTTQVVGNIRTAKYTVLSRHHPNGQALNTGVSFIQTSLVSPRSFTPPTAVVTFKGFSSAGWTLKNNVTQVTAVTGTSISISDVQANRWYISPPSGVVANGTTVQLTYSNDLSSVVNSYPVKTYIKDDFPFVQAANDSIWQVRRIGPSPALPVSQLIGALWSEINRVGLAQSDVFIELMEPLIHAFLYDSREPNRQQWRFTLASMYGGYITVIPKTPNAFRNESVKLRILYDGRPSPIYTIQFQPLWSIFSEITTTEISVTSVPTADIPLSPSLVELGYKWELTEGNALRLASTQVNLLSIGPYSRTQMYIPKAPVQSPSILANSVITITIDQADRNIFDYSTIYPYISYNASVPLIFYLTKRPLNGIVTINGESATRWLPTDGSFVYQHNGSLTFTDTFELSVASNPFDVSATMLRIDVTIRPIPYVTILKQDKLFASDLSELSILRTFEKTADAETLFQVISTNGYLHVTASNYLIPTSNTYSISANTTAPIKYTINPLIALSENPPISVTFTVNASSTYHVNPLVAYPAYASLFAYTMSATLNHHTSINAFQDREQPSQNQGFVYSIDSKDIGAKNLVDRSVGIYLEYQPNYLINYSSNALAFNQISRIKSCRYVFEGLTSGDDGPLFRFDVTHKATTASVQFTMKDQVYNLSNIDIDTPTDVYNSLYFVSNEENDDGSRSVAFYLGFSFENTQNVNANRNVLSLLKVPPIKLDTMTSLQFRYDLQDSANFIGSSNIVIPSGPLKVSYSLSNYATTLLLRNFQVLINTNTLSEINGGEELYDPYKYNVVIGNALAVRGVDNICIGSTFTTSGQNSIILGNNIGVANNEQINEIYESIVIGSESFANAFVRDVIAIGKNIYNDLIDVELERVADFLSFKPIMIGNDITKNMLDFHVNVGNVFLCTAQISKQIYLGIGNEAIGIGYTSNQGFTSAALNVNGATATTSITLAAGSGTLGYHGYSYTGQLGDVVRYGANNILSATTLRNETLTLGVWSGSDTVSQLVTTGRSRIYVTGVVAAGDLLASYGPGAPEGTAMAQTGTMAQARMSYTVAKALETVNVALGSRVLIDCFVLSG